MILCFRKKHPTQHKTLQLLCNTPERAATEGNATGLAPVYDELVDEPSSAATTMPPVYLDLLQESNYENDFKSDKYQNV